MRIGSIFSGIGGLELGLERAGVGRTVWQCECDEYALAVLAKYWPDAQRFRDVRALDESTPPVDVICGGFPCQDISNAGRRDGITGKRSGLFFELMRVVRLLRPRFVVLENVAALLGRGFGAVLGELSESGFDAEWSVLSACALGAPYPRDRVFLIAYADSYEQSAFSVNEKVGELSSYAGSVWNGWYEWPAMARENDGISRKLDRLRCLGNAVVPQVAEVVGRRLMEIAGR